MTMKFATRSLIALFAVTLVGACSKNQAKKDAAKVAPKATEQVGQSVEKTDADKLNETFKSIYGKFDASNTTLASKIEGLGVQAVRTNEVVNASIGGGQVSTMEFTVLVSQLNVDITVSVDADGVAAMKKGSVVDAKIEGINKSLLENSFGGTPGAKVKCLEETCSRIGLLFLAFPQDGLAMDAQPSMAGYILEKGDGGYHIVTSMGSTQDLEAAKVERSVQASK